MNRFHSIIEHFVEVNNHISNLLKAMNLLATLTTIAIRIISSHYSLCFAIFILWERGIASLIHRVTLI
jgi:hypothetical protein